MTQNANDRTSETTGWRALEPYAQLLRSLMPRAEHVWVFDAANQLRWTTESMTGPDLPLLIQAAADHAHGDASLQGELLLADSGAAPIYIWWLRTDAGQLLATVAVSARRYGDTEPQQFSLVNSLLRPAIECLRRELVAQSSLVGLAHRLATRDKDMDLLLSVSDVDSTGERAHVDELKGMLQRAADHLHCVLSALIVPEKSIAMMRAGTGREANGSLLARTHRHLLQLMQTRREAVIINRVTAGSGEAVAFRILCSPLRHPSGRVTGALALFREATAAEFEQRDARLADLLARRASAIIEASYDSLTGLLTRPALEQRLLSLESELGAAPIESALYIDVDQLHAINDNFGMHEGDAVLGQIGEVIRRRLPTGALAARISGDRFAVLLPMARALAADFAESLRDSIAQIGTSHSSTRLHVSVSIGVAALERSSGPGPLAHALAAAESACKAAKDRGRNRVDVHQEADASIIMRFNDITTVADLRDALTANRFRLDAQLIQSLGDHSRHRTPHFELLLRMIDRKGETVGPDRFLSAARRYQLMPAIDRWVLRAALSMLRPHASLLAHRPVVFSINVSGQSIGDEQFADELVDGIEASGVEPGVFCVELTESDAVQNIARAETLMRRLRAIGCGVALDDFGTGLSSLAYLRSLPATLLKIDGSFVRDILRDPRSESMVCAIAQLASGMGIATVAEYAETPEIVARLASVGVDMGQGFALGRPMPLADLLAELPLYASLTPLPGRQQPESDQDSAPQRIVVNH
jgi:diguanylate cyclase (GGDEF)-like protein